MKNIIRRVFRRKLNEFKDYAKQEPHKKKNYDKAEGFIEKLIRDTVFEPGSGLFQSVLVSTLA